MRNTTFEQLIADHDESIQNWARTARTLILKVRPDAKEEIESSWGGYLLFKQPIDGGNTVCFVSAHQKHVSLGFSEGTKLADPSGLLQGTGKLQRHVKIKKETDLQRPELLNLISAAWQRQPDSDVLEQSLDRLRQFCLALPHASETRSHGHPNFKVKNKPFAIYGIYSPSVAFKADLTLHAELAEDDRFYPTPYLAQKGWLSTKLDEQTDWNEVERLVNHSYSLTKG